MSLFSDDDGACCTAEDCPHCTEPPTQHPIETACPICTNPTYRKDLGFCDCCGALAEDEDGIEAESPFDQCATLACDEFYLCHKHAAQRMHPGRPALSSDEMPS